MTDTETRDRRQTILDLAAELFAAKGIAATTVRDIGDAAGILSGSLYHHFESKEAMVEEIVLTYLEGLRESYKEISKESDDPLECLKGFIRASFSAIDEHRYACEIYQNDLGYLHSFPGAAKVDEVAADIHRLWIKVFTDGARKGQFRTDIDSTVYYRFARDAIWFTVRWYKPGGRYRSNKLADDFIMVLLEGIRTTPRQGSGRTNNGSKAKTGKS
ncbi:MAG: TetR/AcrR family transcriptional regulator [Acidimicrobiales bacterium]